MVLQVRSLTWLKSKCQQSCIPSWRLQERIVFLPFPASRGCPHSLAHGRLPVFVFVFFFELYVLEHHLQQNILFSYSFIFGCAGSLVLHVGCSLVVVLRLLIEVASFVVECELQAPRLSSWGAGAQLPHDTWNLCRPGHEPLSPALAGGFITTGPPGKSHL